MKAFLKVFLSGVLGAFVFGIIGGISGAFLSSFIDFPRIGHAAGYESGAIIVGTISIVLSGTLGSWFALPRKNRENTFLAQTGIVLVISLAVVCGSLIAEAEFDDFPRYITQGVQWIVFVVMPFIIARQSMRTPTAS